MKLRNGEDPDRLNKGISVDRKRFKDTVSVKRVLNIIKKQDKEQDPDVRA